MRFSSFLAPILQPGVPRLFADISSLPSQPLPRLTFLTPASFIGSRWMRLLGHDSLPCEAEIGIATILVADAGGAMFAPRNTCGALLLALQCCGHPVPHVPCTEQSAGRFQCLSPLQALPPALGEKSLTPCSKEVASELASEGQVSGLACIEKMFFHCLECAIRSFLLFYFLAVGNLFARGCKLQADRPKINGAIMRARRSLHGAPVCLALGLVAYQMPVCAAMTWPHGGAGSSSTASGQMPDAVATDARRTHPEADVVETFRTRSADAWVPTSGDDAFITATFFSFQASVMYVNAWVGPHEGIQYTCRMLQDEIYDAGLCPCHPCVPTASCSPDCAFGRASLDHRSAPSSNPD